jgi:hypothetical protein
MNWTITVGRTRCGFTADLDSKIANLHDEDHFEGELTFRTSATKPHGASKQ